MLQSSDIKVNESHMLRGRGLLVSEYKGTANSHLIKHYAGFLLAYLNGLASTVSG